MLKTIKREVALSQITREDPWSLFVEELKEGVEGVEKWKVKNIFE